MEPEETQIQGSFFNKVDVPDHVHYTVVVFVFVIGTLGIMVNALVIFAFYRWVCVYIVQVCVDLVLIVSCFNWRFSTMQAKKKFFCFSFDLEGDRKLDRHAIIRCFVCVFLGQIMQFLWQVHTIFFVKRCCLRF